MEKMEQSERRSQKLAQAYSNFQMEQQMKTNDETLAARLALGIVSVSLLASVLLFHGCGTTSGKAEYSFTDEAEISVPEGADVTLEDGNITSIVQVRPDPTQSVSGDSNYVFTCAEGSTCTISVDNSQNEDNTHTPVVVEQPEPVVVEQPEPIIVNPVVVDKDVVIVDENAS